MKRRDRPVELGRLALLILIAMALFDALMARSAMADIKRYAVFVGNNRGDADEPELRYAVSDARKMFTTLMAIGDVPSQQAVLSVDRKADEVRRTLIETNHRIRQDVATSGEDTVLLVYYSGHGDENALHLGGSQFPLDELRSLVFSSPATVRILILDSCRSGPLPRTKGGRPGHEFTVAGEDRLEANGAILIAASAANEDAQESDTLGGSFFTHHLVSGLLGAADRSGDSTVSLEEAYAYAYAGTVRSSSRSAGRPQHPSFHYDVKGMGSIAITRVAAGSERGVVQLREPGHYFVFDDTESGPLVAEVNTGEPDSRLSLLPGRYFIRRRARDHIRETTVRVAPGELVTPAPNSFERIEYAQVVRKGGSHRQVAHSLLVDAGFRGPILDGMGGLPMLGLRYSVAFPSLTIASDFGYGQRHDENRSLTVRTRETHLGLRMTRDFDMRAWSLSAGIVAGAALLLQDFTTDGVAPSRRSIAGYTGLAFGIQRGLGGRLYGALTGDVQTYILHRSDERQTEPSAELTYRLSFGVGAFF